MDRRALLAGMSSLATLAAGCTAIAPPGSRAEEERSGSPPPRTPGVWSQVGGDAHHTRHVPHATGPRSNPAVDWRAFGDRPITAPVVDDRIVVGAPGSSFRTGEIVALDPADGETTWIDPDHDRMQWPGAIYADTILAMEQREDGGDRLSGIDAESGDTAWTEDEGITASIGNIGPTGPTVRGGQYAIGSHRGIVAGDAETGEIEWDATMGERVIDRDAWDEPSAIWAKPCVTERVAITADVGQDHPGPKGILAVDRTSGDEAWTAPIAMIDERWGLRDNLVVGSGMVFVNAQEIEVSAGGPTPPIETENRIYAIDAATGDTAWDLELDVAVLSQLAYADDTLYATAWDRRMEVGQVMAIHVREPSIERIYESEATHIGPPVVGAETLYVPIDEGIAAFDLRRRERAWHLDIDATASWTVLDDDRLLAQTDRANKAGELIAIAGEGG